MLGFKTVRKAWGQFRAWRALYKVTSNDKVDEELKKYGFKVSWLGIPYKLITIPNEFMETPATLNNYIFSQLREINETIAVPLNITELIYPNFIDVAPATYLIKLEPQTDQLRFLNLLPIFALWTILGFVIFRLWIKYDIFQYLVQLWDMVVAFLG